MTLIKLGFSGLCVASGLLLSCSTFMSSERYYSELSRVDTVPAEGVIPQRVELDQAWNSETRQKFWFTSQGSRIVPYSWFTWLEQADSQDYFRSAKHMESLRYLPVKESHLNPSGLPIGFALEYDKKEDEAWMGMTCAACHTNQIDYKGKHYLIEGGPTLGNFVLFYSRLIDAMNVTHKDDAKFERFAHKVLGSGYSIKAAADLRQQLFDVAFAAAQRQEVNSLPESYAEDFTSYARLDAFGNIQNAGTAFALHDVTNKNIPNAPVSYPFLWGTHQSDVVQWNASAPNTPIIGPLVRNVGEVVGVFGSLSIRQAPWWQRWWKETSYSSTVDMIGLGYLESWVKILRSPRWPAALPSIDAVAAAAGAPLYKTHCASCHTVIPREKEGDNYVATQTPLVGLDTDPAQAVNAKYHQAKTLVLEGTKEMILFGDTFPAVTRAIDIPVNGVVGIVLKDPKTALKAGFIPEFAGSKKDNKTNEEEQIKQMVKEFEARREALTETGVQRSSSTDADGAKSLEGLVYKARPLNGIWATAPYLHNGSVANLWELMQEPKKRKTRFWVGSREFDPKQVGYETDKGLSEFRVLDKNGKIQPGNSNLGHAYGTQLSDQQKWQLVEYMKTL